MDCSNACMKQWWVVRRQRRRAELAEAAEPDLEQPLLQDSVQSAVRPVEPIKEASEEASTEEAGDEEPGQSAFSWWDASMQATLAAVLCLWALKLVQQGYVDGESPQRQPVDRG